MDVTCFCGCRFSCAGDLGTCPGCGEYVSLKRVSDAEEKQMRAELDLLLTDGAAAHRRRERPAGARDMEHEFSSEWRPGAPRSRASAPESR
jgi:hypothetical protein